MDTCKDCINLHKVTKKNFRTGMVGKAMYCKERGKFIWWGWESKKRPDWCPKNLQS